MRQGRRCWSAEASANTETMIGVGNCILGYADGVAGAPAPRRDGRIIRA